LAFPFIFIGRVLELFITPGSPGIKMVGAGAFVGGVLLGADSYWQLFGGTPIFPFFEDNSLGLFGFGKILITGEVVGLIFCIFMSFLITFLQGKSIRGGSLKTLESEYRVLSQHKVKKPNSSMIDLAKIKAKEIKHAGVNEHRFLGVVATGLWAFEIISTLAAHNPLDQPSPVGMLGCLMYCGLKICSGEIGYIIWKTTSS
jgi:hypothetical protein